MSVIEQIDQKAFEVIKIAQSSNSSKRVNIGNRWQWVIGRALEVLECGRAIETFADYKRARRDILHGDLTVKAKFMWNVEKDSA